jgi:hypothetical protein
MLEVQVIRNEQVEHATQGVASLARKKSTSTKHAAVLFGRINDTSRFLDLWRETFGAEGMRLTWAAISTKYRPTPATAGPPIFASSAGRGSSLHRDPSRLLSGTRTDQAGKRLPGGRQYDGDHVAGARRALQVGGNSACFGL